MSEIYDVLFFFLLSVCVTFYNFKEAKANAVLLALIGKLYMLVDSFLFVFIAK